MSFRTHANGFRCACSEVNTAPLAWLPATQGAVALRLLTLDAAVRYGNETLPWRETLPAYDYVQIPALSLDRSKVHTVSGMRLTGGESFMPQLPPALLPLDPIDLEVDVEWLEKSEDESHLRRNVPAGMPRHAASHCSDLHSLPCLVADRVRSPAMITSTNGCQR
jgi:hypothetical protein